MKRYRDAFKVLAESAPRPSRSARGPYCSYTTKASQCSLVDGNKRTAFLALGLLLAVNGWRLETTQIDAIETIL